MSQKVLLIWAMGVLFTLSSCIRKINGNIEIEPGRRDYIWTVDTLNMPMNLINSVWGASPDNVWAIGEGGTQDDRLLHYDGEEWTTYTKETIWCTATSLFGFSADDVWMGGGSGWLAYGAGIWHFDGVEWTRNYVYDIEDTYSIQVVDIWGTDPNDVYACGTICYSDDITGFWRGFVLHYDGKSWKEVARANFDSQFITIRKEQDNVYVFSYRVKFGSLSGDIEFYQLIGNKLEKLYSNKETQIYWASLYTINEKAYFVIDHDVYRYIYGEFMKLFSIHNENFDCQICGRNEYDLFLFMKDGLAHFNGADIEYLYPFTRSSIILIKNAVLFQKEVFFCGFTRTDRFNLILHGTLQE